ncbi:MAG TPA: glycosyltransferase 87 family protein [Candidatus Dormibacteraeota bacterium]|nr:glycosyltransferase 87 family protein [Candidatus Dormibacteraeota bacterium]
MASRPGVGGRAFGWAPGRGTAVCLGFSVVLAAYLFTPTWWFEIGADAKVFYAAGQVAASGGDPYQVSQINRMEDLDYNRGADVPFGHAPYGYPPLVTALFRAGAALPEVTFYLVSLTILVAAGLAGFEFCLDYLGWQRRALPRAFFLASTPMALDAFVGNPSGILLLASAAGAWLVARGRPLAGGIALSVMSLKPQVGLPIAAAILLGAPFAASPGHAVPRAWMLTIGGFGAGGALLAGLGIVLVGPSAFAHWMASLAAFGAALGPGGEGSAFAQSGLAGLPSLFGGALPLAAAILAPAAVLFVLSARVLRPGSGALGQPTTAPLALAIAVFLALSPYLHLNDLVLGALPVLFIASEPQNALTRITLLVWTVGPLAREGAAALLGTRFGLGGVGQAGFGAVMTGTLVLSVIWVLASRPSKSTRTLE